LRQIILILLLPFIAAGKADFGVEYSHYPVTFCPPADDLNFDFLKKNLELAAWRLCCQ